MGIQKINAETCTGCGLCFESCPMDVIRIHSELKKAYVAYPSDCIVCFSCESDCPTGSVIITPDRAKPMPSPW